VIAWCQVIEAGPMRSGALLAKNVGSVLGTLGFQIH